MRASQVGGLDHGNTLSDVQSCPSTLSGKKVPDKKGSVEDGLNRFETFLGSLTTFRRVFNVPPFSRIKLFCREAELLESSSS